MENNKINDGGAAFPQPCTESGYASDSPYKIAGGGMSLKDYIAVKAMQALAREFDDGHNLVKASYDVAEAMLQERERRYKGGDN